MNIKHILSLFMILLILFAGCKKKEIIIPEGYITLSELENKTDYYLPFALYNDTNIVQKAVLNGEEIEFPYGSYFEFDETGFYELVLIYKDLRQENDTFLFTTKNEEREASEWGIRTWVPAKYSLTTTGSESVVMYYPHRYTDSVNVPFIFYAVEGGSVKPVYCKGRGPGKADFFNVKRGVGSYNLFSKSITGQVRFSVDGKSLIANPAKVTEPDIELEGMISAPIIIPANSLVNITGDLTISPSGSVMVNEGAVITVDEAVDIVVNGPLTFSGTATNPVLVTCSNARKYWGGFLTKETTGRITADYTIFCRSGYHQTSDYAWGHAGRQALFYTENSTLTLSHCFMLDHVGQIFYPVSSSLILDNILVQRAKTGGQINDCDLTLSNSIFTDFPDDSYVFQDNDNDALYLIGTDGEISNTTFMFAKDDGLDSGGDEGGEVSLTNCRFEACFHEGAALSSSEEVYKSHSFTGCVFTNCGQGLELGFSSPNHTVTVDNCQFLKNGTGIRYGDNYTWSSVNGTMSVKNSSSLDNDRDVWNMVRKIWGPKLGNMTFENTVVSKLCPQYPDLSIKP